MNKTNIETNTFAKDSRGDSAKQKNANKLSAADQDYFYRPLKQPISIRLDADLYAWLKGHGKGYQGRINDILRAEMIKQTGQK